MRRLIFLSLLLATPAIAEPIAFGHLYCGDVQRAEIKADGEQHLWTIDLRAGDRIDIVVAPDEPDPTKRPVWRLIAPGGLEVGDLSYRALRDVHESGTYQVLIEDHFGQAIGGYSVQAQWIGDRACATALDCGYLERGTIDEPARRDAWFFDGESGEAMRLAVGTSVEGFEPSWRLYGPSGRDFGSPRELILPESGNYTLLVGARRAEGTGPYTVTRLGLSAENACAIPLEFDEPIRRRPPNRQASESFAWLAEIGDVVEIGAITLDAGAFPPRIVVYDPSGYPLTMSSEGRPLRLAAEARGRYTIVVWDTMDEFELSIRAVPSTP